MRARAREKLRALENSGERAVLLIHGDYGSGKSAALRALEESPPAGLRAAYVPVPTLDFSGIARWCLDCLGAPVTPDPPAALRTTAERSRVLLLVDDADRLALDVALALRQLERDANGGVAIAAACGSDRTDSAPIVALGPPQRSFEIAAGAFERTAREVRGMFEEPAAAAAAAHAPRRAAPARAATAGAARRAALAASSSEPSAAHADGAKPIPRPAIGVLAAPLRPARATRAVPLSVALALCAIAFVLPAAFFAGFLLGRGGERAAELARVSQPVPEVSAPPPQPPAPAPSAAQNALEAPDASARSGFAAEAPARGAVVGEQAASPARVAAAAKSEAARAEPPAREPQSEEPSRSAQPLAESSAPVAASEATPLRTESSETVVPPDLPKRDARTAAAAPAPAPEPQRDSTPTVEPSWGAPTMIRVSPADEAN